MYRFTHSHMHSRMHSCTHSHMHRITHIFSNCAALALLMTLVACQSSGAPNPSGASTAIVTHTPAPTAAATTGASPVTNGSIQHYEYVFPDGGMYVYDIDTGQNLVEHVDLPTAGVRGVVASPLTHMLYISYGSDHGPGSKGSLLKYDLVAHKIVWTKDYTHGIDSMAISPDGQKIYMPDGELSSDGVWYIEDGNTGNDIGTISGGKGPHNTVVSLNGKHVYLGSREYNYLEVADTATGAIIRQIGPLKSTVRPFTINGAETLAYTIATGFLGFQVSDITTGRVLYTVPIKGFSWNSSAPNMPSAPSHGISLSPNEKELYVIDAPNSYVHVFDVSHVPASAPVQVADIPLTQPMLSRPETPCAYDCLKDGWLQHSRDGRFVYVGDAGDVIATTTRKVVAYLPPLANTRKMLEIDWSNGLPIATTSRIGLGYVT
jgi:DNA-binding beta-propeller fold protein YncE